MNEVALLDIVVERELERDESVLFFATTTSPKWRERFPGRVRSFAISEPGMVGMATGAAMCGYRPIVDINRASFIFLVMDQLVNHAARIHYLSGGQYSVPLVIMSAVRGRMQLGPQNEQCPYGLFMQLPGLNVAVPGSIVDACGLLQSALRRDCPVLFFIPPSLGDQSGMRAALAAKPLPFGKAVSLHQGDRATVVAIGGAVEPAISAAHLLSKQGIDVHLLDPRTLVPLDTDAITTSVMRTGRLLLVDDGPQSGAPHQILAKIVQNEHVAEALSGRVAFVCCPDVLIPSTPALEGHLWPSADRIIEAVGKLVNT